MELGWDFRMASGCKRGKRKLLSLSGTAQAMAE